VLSIIGQGEKKNYRELSWISTAALGDLSEVSGELLFFDDEEVVCVRLDQSQVPEALHKLADPGPCGTNHLRQFFMRNLRFDANAARIFLAYRARQLQQRCSGPPKLDT
jgi:hypothetical protein